MNDEKYANKKTNKTWLNWLKERFKPRQKQQINYNFNMENFFTLNGKIEENRQRLREFLDLYKKIENYYPLFFAYVALIGVYSFDIFNYFINLSDPHSIFIFGGLTALHIGMFIYAFSLFFKLIFLKPLLFDILPKDVYSIVFDQVSESEPKTNEENLKLSDKDYQKKIEDETKKLYLERLEDSLKKNVDSYIGKKKILTKLIKIISWSVLVYILLTTTYKLNIMDNPEVNKPKTEQTTPKEQITVKKTIFVPVLSINENKIEKPTEANPPTSKETEKPTNIAKFNVAEFFIETFKHLAHFKFGK